MGVGVAVVALTHLVNTTVSVLYNVPVVAVTNSTPKALPSLSGLVTELHVHSLSGSAGAGVKVNIEFMAGFLPYSIRYESSFITGKRHPLLPAMVRAEQYAVADAKF